MISWEVAQDFSELIRNIALTFASIFGALIAWKGLRTWKNERKWDRDERLATGLLKATYEFRESIYRFRREGITREESQLIKPPEKGLKTLTEVAMSGMGGIYQNRLLSVMEASSVLRLSAKEAYFFWGDLPSAVDNLINEEFTIRQFLFDYYSMQIVGVDDEEKSRALEHFERNRGILVLNGPDSRERNDALERQVAIIEDYVKSKMARYQ